MLHKKSKGLTCYKHLTQKGRLMYLILKHLTNTRDFEQKSLYLFSTDEYIISAIHFQVICSLCSTEQDVSVIQMMVCVWLTVDTISAS